jgi:2-oxoisovalerate dehydrogenase E1 component alpha subunit
MTIVANFSIEYTRFLDPQGQPTQPLPAFAQDPKILIELYRWMVLTRVFDTKAIALQRTGKMGTYASSLGQEAVSTALGHVMRKEDVLCPYYREYAAQFQRGVKMSEILLYWGGDERGSCFANNREDFPISVPIGSQSLHAVGVATAFKIRKQARVAATVCGDGATSEGDFYEAINVAGAWHLPVVFIVNNNQWAISVPRKTQTGTPTLAQKAIAGGFSGEQVDGNDVIALRYVIERALEKARSGGGPSLIEAITYRLCDHTTADDASRYRHKAELEKAWSEEPIARLRTYLLQQNMWSPSEEEKLLAECAAQVEAAVQEYLATPPPSIESMFDYHYAELPHDLKLQRAEALAFPVSGGHGHG